MKKVFALGVALVLGVFVLAAAAAEKPKVPEDGLKLDRVKKVVVFNHSTHEKGMTCVDCHHLVDGVEDYRSCATAGCHDKLDQKDKSVNSYYQAFHKAKGAKFQTCVSCHTKEAGADKDRKRELVGCTKSKCHPS